MSCFSHDFCKKQLNRRNHWTASSDRPTQRECHKASSLWNGRVLNYRTTQLFVQYHNVFEVFQHLSRQQNEHFAGLPTCFLSRFHDLQCSRFSVETAILTPKLFKPSTAFKFTLLTAWKWNCLSCCDVSCSKYVEEGEKPDEEWRTCLEFGAV